MFAVLWTPPVSLTANKAEVNTGNSGADLHGDIGNLSRLFRHLALGRRLCLPGERAGVMDR